MIDIFPDCRNNILVVIVITYGPEWCKTDLLRRKFHFWFYIDLINEAMAPLLLMEKISIYFDVLQEIDFFVPINCLSSIHFSP